MATKLDLGSQSTNARTNFTPTLSLRTPGTSSFTLGGGVFGVYSLVGAITFFKVSIGIVSFTAGTGSGNLLIGGIPGVPTFANNLVFGNVSNFNGITLPAGVIELTVDADPGGSGNLIVNYAGPSAVGAVLSASNLPSGSAFGLTLQGAFCTT